MDIASMSKEAIILKSDAGVFWSRWSSRWNWCGSMSAAVCPVRSSRRLPGWSIRLSRPGVTDMGPCRQHGSPERLRSSRPPPLPGWRRPWSLRAKLRSSFVSWGAPNHWNRC